MALRPHRPNISSLMFAVYCPWIPSQFSVSAWTQMWDANSGHGLLQRPLSAVWSASKESAGGSSKPPEPVAEHLGLQETCGEEASRTKNQIVHHPSELWVWIDLLGLESCDVTSRNAVRFGMTWWIYLSSSTQDARQEGIRGLIKGNSTTKADLIRLHKEVWIDLLICLA